MGFLRRFLSPIMTFIGIQLLWIVVVILWIVWFVRSHARLRSIAERYSPELLQGGIDWFILVEGLILLVAILAGVYVIFIFWRRQASLNREQKNFIAQVSHELKSPIASLQLHLETIRRRRPPPEKMETFIDTMLADTDRLGNLINNLLMASRFEQRTPKLALRPVNLSELTSQYFTRQRFSLPRAGTLNLQIEPSLWTKAEVESLETAYRNLLENAILYSPNPPRITISLTRRGNQAHLVFADQGQGIPANELKKVFRMFHRVRQGQTIRGSGLGLFIVKAIVRMHRGKVWIESPGAGRGTAVNILLPLSEPETSA